MPASKRGIAGFGGRAGVTHGGLIEFDSKNDFVLGPDPGDGRVAV